MNEKIIKILYVVNIIPPSVSKHIGIKGTFFGGWISEIIRILKDEKRIKLFVATRYKEKLLKKYVIDDVVYYLLPEKINYNVSTVDCNNVINEVGPDILHIEGTEFQHALTFLECYNRPSNVVSLQGILKNILPHVSGGIQLREALKSINVILLFMSLAIKYTNFKIRSISENKIIKKASNILGRTIWDRSHSYYLNKKAKYYVCNRLIRQEFFENEWSSNEYLEHSIFVGNSYQPLKGFHNLLKAVVLLKEDFPNIRVFVSGISPYEQKIRKRKLRNAYQIYIISLIEKNELTENIIFLGELSATEMIKYMSVSNVYCLASAIENSPNTLAEAMVLGVPTVASFVGGVDDMIKNKDILLYRYGDIEVMAYQIKRLFDSKELCQTLSLKSKTYSRVEYNQERTRKDLLYCYDKILYSE